MRMRTLDWQPQPTGQVRIIPGVTVGAAADDRTAGRLMDRVAGRRHGHWFTLDNRRLVAFQQAGVNIPFRMATPAEVAAEAWKLTTTNGGASIIIRQGWGTWP